MSLQKVVLGIETVSLLIQMSCTCYFFDTICFKTKALKHWSSPQDNMCGGAQELQPFVLFVSTVLCAAQQADPAWLLCGCHTNMTELCKAVVEND